MNTKRSVMTDHKEEHKVFVNRLISVSLMIIIMSSALIYRLYHLQITENQYYSTLSEQNQLNLVPLRPSRGLIYDRNGIILAENIPVYSLDVIPEYVGNLRETIANLKNLVNITKDDLDNFYKRKRHRRRYAPIPLRLRLTQDEVAKFSVNRYHFPGVSVTANMVRNYPLRDSFAHVLGYVGRINEQEMSTLDNNYSATNYIGKLGVEGFYEDILHGNVGYKTVETDATGRVLRTMKTVQSTAGYNLYLTIDAHLQLATEHALANSRGAVVVIDPNNGDVLALVSNPSFDPNLFVQGISHKDYGELRKNPKQPLYNRAVRGQYPMASTIKPFMALGGLAMGVVTKHFKIRDPGYYQLPGTSHVYKDWKKTGHGVMHIRRAVTVSCDTFFYILANMMGVKRQSTFIRKFGFGHKTGLDMKEELSGNVPDPAWKRRRFGKPWYTGDTIVSGIGQGYMLTTPMQLANATATMAMRGRRFHPHLLLARQRVGAVKIPYEVVEAPPMDVTNQKYWDIVHDGMRKVITSGEGTGYRFGRNAPYTVAAKTGTAQVYSAKRYTHLNKHNLPEHLRDHSLFIAFAPYKQPQIAIAVIVEHSKRASNIAREVMDFYFGVENKRLVNRSAIQHPDDYVG